MTWVCGECATKWPEAVPVCVACLLRERDAAMGVLRDIRDLVQGGAYFGASDSAIVEAVGRKIAAFDLSRPQFEGGGRVRSDWLIEITEETG